MKRKREEERDHKGKHVCIDGEAFHKKESSCYVKDVREKVRNETSSKHKIENIEENRGERRWKNVVFCPAARDDRRQDS